MTKRDLIAEAKALFERLGGAQTGAAVNDTEVSGLLGDMQNAGLTGTTVYINLVRRKNELSLPKPAKCSATQQAVAEKPAPEPPTQPADASEEADQDEPNTGFGR